MNCLMIPRRQGAAVKNLQPVKAAVWSTFAAADGEKDAPLLNPDGKKTGSGEKINLKEWMRSIR